MCPRAELPPPVEHHAPPRGALNQPAVGRRQNRRLVTQNQHQLNPGRKPEQETKQQQQHRQRNPVAVALHRVVRHREVRQQAKLVAVAAVEVVEADRVIRPSPPFPDLNRRQPTEAMATVRSRARARRNDLRVRRPRTGVRGRARNARVSGVPAASVQGAVATPEKPPFRRYCPTRRSNSTKTI